MKRCLRLLLTWVLILLSVATVSAAPLDFNRDVKPILSNNCYQCHGPDADERKGGSDGLRLDTADGATHDLGGYAAIVPGKPESSEAIKRILSADPDEVMPPKHTGKRLSPREIDVLRRWISEGGRYATHWSYAQPVRPELPKISDAAWVKTPVDRFILSRLDQERLKPQAEADRYALIRRLALDLTGLPPTIEEVDQFVADKDPSAYDKLVTRLLEKPTFGEHWAHMWLDLARYADSAGYADDPSRTIWLYRDYVIRSLNANKPFDQFTLEQIAGDMLASPSDEQLIATAFHRNTLTNNEGGTNDEEFRNVAVVDRVNTTLAVWMGTTIACAQCHNHKYDPISQEEFFRVFDIFNQSEDADRRDESPLLSYYTSEQKQQRSAWEHELKSLDETLSKMTPELQASLKSWEKKFPRELDWRVLKPSVVKTQAGADSKVGDDSSVLISSVKNKNDTYTIELPLSESKLRALRIESLPHEQLPAKGAGHDKGNFLVTRVTAKVVTDTLDKPFPIATAVADFTPAGLDPQHVVKNPDAKKNGWSVTGQPSQPHALTLVASADVNVPPNSTLVVTIEHGGQVANQTLGHFRLSVTADPRAAEQGRTPLSVLAALEVEPEKRQPAQVKAIEQHFLSVAPELKTSRDRAALLRKQLADLQPATVPVQRELAKDKRRVTKIQHRGNFLDEGRQVGPGIPAVFASSSGPLPQNRLELARWLVDANNPLTARVIANRYWEQLFGTGIVATSEEFGAQGDLPFHPELLDWLATELVRLKWDTKAFIRLLVSSAAYRQSTRVTPELQQRDPDNRLLARGPRFRSSAEVVRDQALFVAGLLSTKQFGPPVKPPQPSMGLSAAFGSGIDWQTSNGEDRYRRALYTTWRRSNPYPSMAAFDAPNREVCTLRRGRTNTPLQALVTLNDPVYIEAAQGLGRRVVAHGGSSLTERMRYAFRLCLARPPRDDEATRLVKLYEQMLAQYRADAVEAKKLATDPLGPVPAGANEAELAAWTVVGNVLLNLDETLMKR